MEFYVGKLKRINSTYNANASLVYSTVAQNKFAQYALADCSADTLASVSRVSSSNKLSSVASPTEGPEFGRVN